MKKYLTLICLIGLAACGGSGGGGSGGGGSGTVGSDIQRPSAPTVDTENNTSGTVGKSVYQLWLDAGNVGTEQEFLDALVSNSTGPIVSESRYKSLREEASHTNEYKISEMYWPGHGNYFQMEKNTIGTTTDNNTTREDTMSVNKKIVYNEKELNLVNYGVYLETNVEEHEFANTFDTKYRVYSWINNRDGIAANIYTPEENTVFKGSTMAYLADGYYSYNATEEPILIKGDAEYTHSATNPKLILDFDNYYTFVIENSTLKDIQGTNGINVRYDLEKTNNSYIYSNTVNIEEPGFTKKANIEEVVAEYEMKFFDSDGNKFFAPNGVMSLSGAFGATKQ